MIDDESCYRAVRSRDRRFDGWFFVGVTSTGIFCRPSCPATTPRRANVRFFPSAAAAQGAGFRACRRCRPDTAPGSPAWNVAGDLARRAVHLIDDGVVDREGVGGVAGRLAVSERHLHRVLVAELGASPVALARSRRAQTARVLIETTDLPVTEIAFASGFSSIRQFNDTVRAFFAASPTELRAGRASAVRRGRAGDASEGPPAGAG
ncbi:MAG: methylphosphotriester-DNA--protein-cysteine methyltransferase family protein, partial [Acidimicrobiales bacterium]|nr:methylphosphotriester-DNA--protein-cysteine methyltransferase family protein [Acidimicrobiales bacterium]